MYKNISNAELQQVNCAAIDVDISYPFQLHFTEALELESQGGQSPSESQSSFMHSPSSQSNAGSLEYLADIDEMFGSNNNWNTGQYSSNPTCGSSISPEDPYRRRPISTIPRNGPSLPSLTEMNLCDNGDLQYNQQSARYVYNQNAYGLSADPYNSYNQPKLAPTSYYSQYNPVHTSRLTYSQASYDHCQSMSSPYDLYPANAFPPIIPGASGGIYMGSDTASINSRRRRGNLPKHVTDILRSWFHDHLEHPYPTDEDKHMLMSRTNLTMSQISNWFINARRRHWPALRAQRGVDSRQARTTS